MSATITLTLGRMLWRPLRDYVAEQKFKGADIALWESSGLIERRFVLKGSDAAMAMARRDVARWIKGLRLDEQKLAEAKK